MRAHIIFPQQTPPRRIDARLLHALSLALQTTRRLTLRQDAGERLGSIDLPDTAPTQEDAGNLQSMAPLYLAFELEQAGVMRTAELVAGLFASGAITQPLGPTAQLIAEFWKARSQRMAEAERLQLFAQMFDRDNFYPLMSALCDAIVAQGASPLETLVGYGAGVVRTGNDIQAQVALQEAAEALGAWLAPHAVGMALFAAHDIVQALNEATRFLRDRMLQTAFGVHDLWGLIGTVGSARGDTAGQVRDHVELGREGATVITWLAGDAAQGTAGNNGFNAASAQGQQLMASAQAWRMAWAGVGKAAQTVARANAQPPIQTVGAGYGNLQVA